MYRRETHHLKKFFVHLRSKMCVAAASGGPFVNHQDHGTTLRRFRQAQGTTQSPGSWDHSELE